MNDKEAIATAKRYMLKVFAEEEIGNLRLEEFEYAKDAGRRIVTLSFSRPWGTPRTRVQEVLENFGAEAPTQRFFKVVTLSEDGRVLSVKDRSFPAAAE